MNKKILIVFYSRTGTTKTVAEFMAKELGADLEEIKGVKNYSGAMGYLMAGREATLKKAAAIEPAVKNPTDYDLVIVGTPIWSFNVASPVRAYLEQQKDKIKKTAFFCTMGGSGDQRAFTSMAETCGQKPLATLTLLTKEVAENKFEEKTKEFLDKIKN